MHIQAATGPWEPITEFDEDMKKIRDIMPSGTVQGEPVRSSEGRIVRFKLMHKLDRKTYALRLAAFLQNGQIMDTPFYDEDVSDEKKIKGFVRTSIKHVLPKYDTISWSNNIYNCNKESNLKRFKYKLPYKETN